LAQELRFGSAEVVQPIGLPPSGTVMLV
jgi:hypothetical protein